MKTSNIFYMMCATALFSSCHIYKAYDRPEDINADGIYRDPISLTDTLAVTDTTNMGNVPWKEMFTDPKLQALIEEGLANNVDMQAAILRVEEARVMLTSARLSFLPSINLAPQGSLGTVESQVSRTYTLPVTASWELDIFGKLRNAKRQAKAAYAQSEDYQQAVYSSLIANIANNYYTLLMLDEQLAISRETAASWKETVASTQALMDAGLADENPGLGAGRAGRAGSAGHPRLDRRCHRQRDPGRVHGDFPGHRPALRAQGAGKTQLGSGTGACHAGGL